MMLQQGELVWPMNWTRNAEIIYNGIQAVRAASDRTDKKMM